MISYDISYPLDCNAECNKFNILPLDIIKIIKLYVGLTQIDISLIYNKLKINKIKWAFYEKPTRDIYKIVEIIPFLFKKGTYVLDWDVTKPSIKTQKHQIENEKIIVTDCNDYDMNIYDFEYFYKYTIESLKLTGEEEHLRPYPIRNIYISRLDLIISFLFLGYELDEGAFNYNIDCICKLIYDINEGIHQIEYKKKDYIINIYKNKQI